MNAESERLVHDLHQVVIDAEDVLAQLANSSSEGLGVLRERIDTRLKEARDTIGRARQTVVERGAQGAHATQDYIVGHPWQSVAIASAIGVVVGLLIRRH